jgi:DHA1 family inner membrane transport protein
VTATTTPERTVGAQLVALTGAKVVTNTALRWVGPFLPTLERAFSTSTGTLTGIMGVAELGGLTTLASGSQLDRGRERAVFMAGIALVGLSSVIALTGTTWAFAVAFVLLVIGVSNHTIAGHAWIGHRVPFAARSRSIGVFEMSWAIALLAGAPLLAVLIDAYGWRGPYVALAIASAVAVGAVYLRVDAGRHIDVEPTADVPRAALPRTAWLPMIASAATAMAGLGVFVVSGAWLDDEFGVSTGGLGAIAALFGAVELGSSSAVAAFADRVGARRSVVGGLAVLVAGGVVMASAGSQTVAVVGLAIYLTGFEYGFVASLTLVTEAAPDSRGKAIGISNAIGTIARSTGVIVSGQLYEAFGIRGSLTMAAAATTVALALIVASA